MSRVLSELLGVNSLVFNQTIQDLESAADKPGVDIRLGVEIENKLALKYRELGLDPKDSNGRELFHSLQQLTGQHNLFLARAFGVDDPDEVTKLLPVIRIQIGKLAVPRTCWVLKHPVARRLLKQMPPKKIMKQLGYRSVDSMLKRENIAELFVALRALETSDWQTRFIRTYKKLSSQDFETRKIEIVVMSAEKWGTALLDFVQDRRMNVTHLKELGVVGLLPMPVRRMPGICLMVTLQTLRAIDEIRTYSALFKLEQVRPDFSEGLVRTILHDPTDAVSVVGRPLHWRMVRRHFGSKPSGEHAEVFEPHVQLDDLKWVRSEEVLYRVEPALKFWENLEYCGIVVDGKAISLNLLDNAGAYCNGMEYGQQTVYHMRSSLWNELLLRYIGQKKLEAQMLEQLDSTLSMADLNQTTKGAIV